MDKTNLLLYAQIMEWFLKVGVPILTVTLPLFTYFHMQRKNDMEKKADKEDVEKEFKLQKEIHDESISNMKEDIRDIKKSNLILESKIMDELKYIRTRVDQMADKKK